MFKKCGKLLENFLILKKMNFQILEAPIYKGFRIFLSRDNKSHKWKGCGKLLWKSEKILK